MIKVLLRICTIIYIRVERREIHSRVKSTSQVSSKKDITIAKTNLTSYKEFVGSSAILVSRNFEFLLV
jgi:hypothetical protein